MASYQFLLALVLVIARVAAQPSTNNKALCWGWDDYRPALNVGSSPVPAAPLLSMALASSPLASVQWASIYAGQYATCGVSWLSPSPTNIPVGSPTPSGNPYTGGNMYCWGHDYGTGWLSNNAQESPVPIQVDGGVQFVPGAVAMSAGFDFQAVCGVTLPQSVGNVWCSGSTDLSSNIPTGHTFSVNNNSICVGNDFACAISRSGAMYCWGAPTVASISLGTGWGVVSGTYSIPSLGTGVTWSQVACGAQFACGIASNSATYCWGNVNGWSTPLPPVPLASPQLGAAIAAGWNTVCMIGTGSNANLHCYGYTGGLTNALTKTNGYNGPWNPSVLALSDSGGCVVSATAGPTPTPSCWDPYYYPGNNIPASGAPVSPAPPQAFNQISGGFGYFCGVTW